MDVSCLGDCCRSHWQRGAEAIRRVYKAQLRGPFGCKLRRCAVFPVTCSACVPLGIAYAMWAGIGIVLVSLVGVVVFRQTLDFAAIAGIGLIVAGVIVINTLSNSTTY